MTDEHKNIRAALDAEEASDERKVLKGNLFDALNAVQSGEARSIAQALRQSEPNRILLSLTLDQIAMVHHALANLGNTDPLKADAFRELFEMVQAHVQAVAP